MFEQSVTEFPYPNLRAYQEALDCLLYSSESAEGKAYRATVNEKLQASPCVVAGPAEERKRQYWLSKDEGVQ